jgi:hypothetical protein
MGEDLRDRDRHAARMRDLPRLAVHAQLHGQVARVADLVGRDDPRPERTEGIDRLAEREHARTHLPTLDVPRGDVVEDHVPGDVALGVFGGEPLPVLADDDGELELVVELLGQVLWVDHRVVLADQRVDVLEEDDPGGDFVRPADLLRLLLVLAEVAGRVKELLGDDRRPEALPFDRHRLAGVVRAAALEVCAQVGHVEHADLVALDPPGPRVFAEGHEFHFRPPPLRRSRRRRARTPVPSSRGRRCPGFRPSRCRGARSRSRS